MARVVAVFLLFSFLNSCKGFDFTLDVSGRVPSDGSNTLRPCAVLQCNETLERSPYQIKSLTIYKKVDESDATESWQQLASITSERASESKMSEGARIIGQLTDHHAYLTLDLVETHDCKSSQFLCAVSLEDEQGDKFLKKSMAGKRIDPGSIENLSIKKSKDSLHRVNKRDAQASSAEASPYLTNPFQIKLDRIESRLEDALKNLENRLEDKVENLKEAVIDEIERAGTDIESKLGETESKTDRLENRLEDKLGIIDTRVTETLVLTKAAAASANDNAYSFLATKIDGLENKLKDTLSQQESCATDIIKKDENTEVTGERLLEQLATVVSAVQSMENISCSGEQIHQTEEGAGQSALTLNAENTKLTQLVTSVASLTGLTQSLLTRVQTFSNSYAGGTLVPVDEFSDPLGSGKKEWRLVFRGTAYYNIALYPAYLHGTGIPLEVEQGCKQFNKSLPCVNHYRNEDALDNWINIDEVLFAIYKDGEIVKRVVFNGRGSTYTSWFQVGRVILSSWDDLTTQPHNIFSIIGETNPTYLRRFFMSLDYHGGCDGYRGWFFAFDSLHGGCAAEKTVATPTFLYAVGNTFAVWTSANKALADAIGIYVKYE